MENNDPFILHTHHHGADNQGPVSVSDEDVFSSDLVKSWSRGIGSLNYCMALKFDRRLGITVKFRRDRTIPNTDLAASRLH